MKLLAIVSTFLAVNLSPVGSRAQQSPDADQPSTDPALAVDNSAAAPESPVDNQTSRGDEEQSPPEQTAEAETGGPASAEEDSATGKFATGEQASTDEVLDSVGLEEFLSLTVGAASKGSARSVREVPGIVTILRREEILRSGARDLADVLRLVPGFDLITDEWADVFPSVRGLEASDSVLMLLDGHNLEDSVYQGVYFTNRFPVDWISRVEIIRGPGSVVHGGTAEYAVVNIVTRSASEVSGVDVTGVYSQMLHGVVNKEQSIDNTYGQRNISASYGQVFETLDNLELSINVFAGQGNLSDRMYRDFYGSKYNMAGNAKADPLMANLRIRYQDLSISYLFENMTFSTRDAYGENLDVAIPFRHTTSSLILRYDWRLADNLKITPVFRHVYNSPWDTSGTIADSEEYYDDYIFSVEHHSVAGELTAVWEAAEWLELMAGGQYVFNTIEDPVVGFWQCDYSWDNPELADDCVTRHSNNNIAVFAEGRVKSDYVDITLGGRFEHHDGAGSAFVPRLSVGKVFDPFHFKLLASQGFLAPSSYKLGVSPDLTPEKTTVFEAEAGYRITDYLLFTANTYLFVVDNLIAYFWDDETEAEGFRNEERTGSAGVEAELRYSWQGHFATLNYSYYHPAGLNKNESYTVPGHSDVYMAVAPHKLSLNSGVKILEDLTLNLSFSWLLGDRYGHYAVDEDEELLLRSFPREFLLNANVMYRNLGIEGLWVSLGARNMTNTKLRYVSVSNWHGPIPGYSAEVFLKIGLDSEI